MATGTFQYSAFSMPTDEQAEIAAARKRIADVKAMGRPGLMDRLTDADLLAIATEPECARVGSAEPDEDRLD